MTVSSAGEVTIAGNSEGLRWFAHHILVLARNPDEGHVHLQNEGIVMTDDSNLCVIQYLATDRRGASISTRTRSYVILLKWLMVLGALSLIYMLLVIGWN